MQQLPKYFHKFLTATAGLLLGVGLYIMATPAFGKTAGGSVPVPAVQTAPRILVVGDSISAEYGLKRGTGWVALLENRMAESYKSPKANPSSAKNTTKNIALQAINTPDTAQNKPEFSIINASISGDTSSGGRSRLAPLIDMHRPTHVIIELGANDALRGLPIQMTEDNLNAMTQTALKSGAKVLLLGMQIPPNYGVDYTKQFSATFAKVAKTNKVGLVPFMLKGVADSPDYIKLFQADRIHPTEAAHPRILANIWPELQKQLK